MHNTGQATLEIIWSISPNNVGKTQTDFDKTFASLITIKKFTI